MWSGPSRALQAHLALFERVDRAYQWLVDHADSGATPDMILDGPATLRQRMRLMSSMADNIGPTIIHHGVDGNSLSVGRDSEDEIFSQYNLQRAVGLITTERQILNTGETLYVSHHIAATVEAAAETADDEPLFPTDLPTPRGLLVFEYPLIIPDLHPETGATMPDLHMPLRAIGWSEETIHAANPDTGVLEPGSGIFYTMYTDRDAWAEIFLPSVREHLPDDYDDYREMYKQSMANGQDPLWCIDTSGWSYGKSWRRSDVDLPRTVVGTGEIHATVANTRRFLLTLFRFCWQRILVPQTYHPHRHEHRQSLRVGHKLEDGHIKVLRLRRHMEMEARGEPVDPNPFAYDHQWIVRKHPRRQWYPSLGPPRNPDGSFNQDSHRLIWIEPFIKGNPLAPLIVGHNVTAIVE
jgi:hypothetical protein